MVIKSLLDNKIELLQFIENNLKPKTIEKKSFGEVFTPMNFINNNMLNDIEIYWKKTKNENIWENESLTWYDPSAGIGNYPIAIYLKLMEGLRNKIPNKHTRKKHIIEKQLFIGELNKKNNHIIKQIFNTNNKFTLNIYEGDTLNINIQKIFNITAFDIIIGNPPYNTEFNKGGASPLYNKFIEYYIDKCILLTFIIPSRWFSGGKGLDNFRNMMLHRNDIVYIKHFENACEIFGNSVNIKGGVNYFLIDKTYNGLCNYNGSNIQLNKYDIVLDCKYYTIVNKLLEYEKITNLYCGSNYYNIKTNDERLINKIKKNYLKCYVSQQKGFIKYINKNNVNNNYDFYKVMTTESSYKGNSGFGNIFISNPFEVCSQSYIFFKVNNMNEAKSLLSYMQCKLPNFMLSLRKISQHIKKSTCVWIPLIPLNEIWTDETVYKYFKLNDEDIKLINNTKINGFIDLKN